jgi:alpha-ribazole phosphatase
LRFAPPGGESGSALVDRVRDVLARLREDRQDCVVVSHGGPLKVLTALLLGVPLDLLVAAPPMGVTRFITIPVDESPVAERGKRHPGGRIADVPATG